MKLSKIKKDKKYLLACSFGPDSMALYALLLKSNIDFDVAFINYHLRAESDEEEKKIKAFSFLNSKNLFIKEVYYDKEKDKNIEKRARDVRYSYFDELNKEHKYEAVLIAHNLDDLIETYIIQTKRSNFVSYYGLKSIFYRGNTKYIRPLLKYRKLDLLNYNIHHFIPYLIDKSNFDNSYLRNDIRNNYVSKLTRSEINKYLKEINEKNKAKKEESKSYLKLVNKDNTIKISDIFKLYEINKEIKIKDIIENKEEIDRINEQEFINFFYYYISKFLYLKDISKKEIIDIYHKIKLNKNMIIPLTNTPYFIFIEYGYFKIDYIYESKYEFMLNQDGNKYIKFLNNKNVENLFKNFEKVLIKPISKDEYYTYINKEGTKSSKRVSHIFIDMKLPSEYRKIYPGIYNPKTNELIYVPRYMKKVKVTSKSIFKFNLLELAKLDDRVKNLDETNDESINIDTLM